MSRGDALFRAVLSASLAAAFAGALLRAQAPATLLAADAGTHLDPIARLGDTGWMPITAAGPVRAPREWVRWFALGGSAPVRIGALTPSSRCAAPRRLPAAAPAASARTAANASGPYQGIAVTSPVPLDLLTRLTEASPAWRRVMSAAAPLFDLRARDHGVSPSTLARVPMTMDVLYGATRRGEAPVYYFETSKRVPDAGNTPEEDPKGIVRIAVSGWLRDAGGSLVPAGAKGELHWEPADAPVAGPGLMPLAVLRHEDEAIWVMAGRMGVRHTFTLYSVGTSAIRTLFSIDAAAC